MAKLRYLLLLLVLIFASANTIYLPMVVRGDVPKLGAHIWAESAVQYQPEGVLTYTPIYPEDVVHYHHVVMPLVKGNPLILGFREVPKEWRYCYGDVELECCPPTQENYYNYAHRILTITQAYIAEGHNVMAIEVWNEPEPFEHQCVGHWQHFLGCWGDTREAGYRYAELVKVIYAVMQANLPDVEVLGGALLFGNPDVLPEFWIGALENDIDSHITGVSFHAYVGFPTNNFDVVTRKAALLNQHTTHKLWLTEVALLCDIDCETEFELAQLEFLDYIMGNALEHNIKAITWFMLANNYWRNSDLVMGENVRPAYYRYLEYVAPAQ